MRGTASGRGRGTWCAPWGALRRADAHCPDAGRVQHHDLLVTVAHLAGNLIDERGNAPRRRVLLLLPRVEKLGHELRGR